jgi:hypothetical protein
LHWIETIVIGLDLCPFAQHSIEAARLRLEVCAASKPDELSEAFVAELQHLDSSAGAAFDSTLIIHPSVLQDVLDFNDFLASAEARLEAEGFEGRFQLASFHPDPESIPSANIAHLEALGMPALRRLLES